MKEQQSSITAEGIAMMRAWESAKPPGVRVCYDPYARAFVSPWLWYLSRLFISTGYAERRGPGVMGFLAARCRYIDDYLQKQPEQGIEQLVIIGAGFDSRAYRFPALAERGIRVFEVDHPATQRVKLDKLNKILDRPPEHVTFVPVDFDRQDLGSALLEAGYEQARKTAFIWEGVTYYITATAVDATLAFVAKHSAPGSSIIFDYTFASVVEGTWKRGEARSMQRFRGLTGEGFVFGVEQGKIVPFLEARGFCDVLNADHETLERLYFTGPNAGRDAAPVYSIATAFVKPH